MTSGSFMLLQPLVIFSGTSRVVSVWSKNKGEADHPPLSQGLDDNQISPVTSDFNIKL